MTGGPWTRHVRRIAAATAAMLVAVPLGLVATIGVAGATSRPSVFLAAGAVVTGAAAAAGLRLALRSVSSRLRWRLVSALTGALLLLAAGAILVPLPDPQADPEPVAGQAFWDLETGSRLAYVQLPGTGTVQPSPVLVLHGGPGIAEMAGDAAFFGQLTALGFDVYVYDQLGAGRSERLADPSGYGIDRDVADLEAIRRTMGADRMVLIGHSYGGALAGHYLAAHPDHVEKMILSSPGPLDPTDTSSDQVTEGLDTSQRLQTYAAVLAPRGLLGYALLQVNPAAAARYLPDAEADARNDEVLTIAEPALHCADAQSRGAVHGSGFYALQYPQSVGAPAPGDVRPALAGLPTPTLILKGSCDYLSWQSVIDYRTALPNSSLVYLRGAGHNTYQDRPASVLANVRAFLTGEPLPQPPYRGFAQPADYQGRP